MVVGDRPLLVFIGGSFPSVSGGFCDHNIAQTIIFEFLFFKLKYSLRSFNLKKYGLAIFPRLTTGWRFLMTNCINVLASF